MSIDELNQYNRLVKEFALAITGNVHPCDTEVSPKEIVDLAERLSTEFMARENSRKVTNEQAPQ